ncbi:hypothetical protein EV401DRAFT_2049085, partial [Pisolithus croceorrhizus]
RSFSFSVALKASLLGLRKVLLDACWVPFLTHTRHSLNSCQHVLASPQHPPRPSASAPHAYHLHTRSGSAH